MKILKKCSNCEKEFLGDDRTNNCSIECSKQNCIKWHRLYNHNRYYKDIDKSRIIHRIKSKNFRKNNPGYSKASNHVCYLKYREKRLKEMKRYRSINKEEINKRNKIWRENNKDYIIQKNKERRATEIGHLEHRIQRHKRRMWEKNKSDNTINKKSIIELMEKQHNKCKLCNINISKKYHIDHIYPLSKGGMHSIKNIQLLCPECNLKKGCNF